MAAVIESPHNGDMPPSPFTITDKAPRKRAEAAGQASMRNPRNYLPPTPAEIKRLRRQADLSQAEAARLIGRSERQWQKYEAKPRAGRNRPDTNARRMPFPELALFCILALDEDPKEWMQGHPKHAVSGGRHRGYAKRQNRRT